MLRQTLIVLQFNFSILFFINHLSMQSNYWTLVLGGGDFPGSVRSRAHLKIPDGPAQPCLGTVDLFIRILLAASSFQLRCCYVPSVFHKQRVVVAWCFATPLTPKYFHSNNHYYSLFLSLHSTKPSYSTSR